MGLVKRCNTWWMSFMYQGQQVRRSNNLIHVEVRVFAQWWDRWCLAWLK